MARHCQNGSGGTLPRASRGTKCVKKGRTVNSKQRHKLPSRYVRLGQMDPGCRATKVLANESVSLLDVNQEVVPTGQRWGALGLFCALAFSQSCIWNTWGPISGSAILAFPTWRTSHVALLTNWGCITYLAFCIPFCWLLNLRGLLMPVRIAAILSTLATFIRCISSQEVVFTAAAHLAAILNGLSGVVVGPATALVSAVWFPPGQRTTATGISAAFNQLGMAASYLVGSSVVGAPRFNATATRTDKSLSCSPEMAAIQRKDLVGSMVRVNRSIFRAGKFPEEIFVDPANATMNPMDLRPQIMSLMRIELVGQLLVLIGILWYFPKQHSQFTANSRRFGVIDSILHLLKNKSMWRLCIAAALSQGVTGPWLAMITMAFGSTVNQDEADKLAFWTIIFSSILSLAASRLLDIFQGYLKVAIYTLLCASSAMFFWVLLLESQVLVFDKGELYAAVILGVSSSWSTPALFLELASEIAFPVSEAIVGGYMIFLANIVGMIFYFSYFVPGMGMRRFSVGQLFFICVGNLMLCTGEHWSSYCVFGNLTVASILVMYVKDEYNRTKMNNSKNSGEAPMRITPSVLVLQEPEEQEKK